MSVGFPVNCQQVDAVIRLLATEWDTGNQLWNINVQLQNQSEILSKLRSFE